MNLVRGRSLRLAMLKAELSEKNFLVDKQTGIEHLMSAESVNLAQGISHKM